MKLKQAVRIILEIENIKSKEDLDVWCGATGREKFYEFVKLLSQEHWNTIRTPKENVRFIYQGMLEGYEIYQKRPILTIPLYDAVV